MTSVTPQFSADGAWWWDGHSWVPAAQARGVAEAFGPGPQAPPLDTDQAIRLVWRRGGLLRLLWAMGRDTRRARGGSAPPVRVTPGARKVGWFWLAAAGALLLVPLVSGAAHALQALVDPRPAVAPVGQSDPVARSLRAAAEAQELYKRDHGVYAATDATLLATGMDTASGVTVHLLRADGSSYYCLEGVGPDQTLYLSPWAEGVTTVPCF